MISEGLDLDQIRERLDFTEEAERFRSGDHRLAYFFDEWYAKPVIERTYDAITGRSE